MNTLLTVIYDIIFIFGFILYLPLYIYRRKITFSALKEKLGFIPRFADLKDKGCLWIQVVSVGEVNLIGALINEWKKMSKLPLVISTTTLTGNNLAKKKYSSEAGVIFFPFDVSFIIRRVLKIINPKVFVAVETEIWPNLYGHLKERNIPIVIINGRVSFRAHGRYKIIKPIIKRSLNQCCRIGVQNQHYKELLLSLGACPQKVVVSGNMKFESIQVDEKRLKDISQEYLSILQGENNLIFIAASTHRPEEEIIIELYENIIESEKNLSLIIAPRHIERTPEIEKVIITKGFNPVRISKLKSETLLPYRNIFLLDVIGQLLYFYGLCDFCFVGGSLIRHGGQNILEPIYFRKPTIFGPYMDNFKDIEERVLSIGAGIAVKDKGQLQGVLLQLVKDEAFRINLSNRCQMVFEQERKSLNKNLRMILECQKQG